MTIQQQQLSLASVEFILICCPTELQSETKVKVAKQ